jgi:putative oxidoreductase
MEIAYEKFLHLENRIHHQLVLHSVAALRVAVGAIFLGFGVLKFFPGVSPAEDLTEATTHILFLGLVPGAVAIKLIATLECVIGICLLINRGMRLAIWLLAIEFVGILSPLVLLPGRLFDGPHGAPNLEGQYVLKDLILVAAGLVIAAGSFRGGRMVRGDLPPSAVNGDAVEIGPEQRARIVLSEVTDDGLIRETCERYGISEADFYAWRETSLTGATVALGGEDHRV